MLKILFLITLTITSFGLSCQEFLIGLNQRDVYRIKDQDNNWQGLDIELIKAVFRRTPYTFKFVDMPWPRVLKSLESGEIDMTLAAAKLPERESYALFSEQHFRYSHYVLFVPRNKLSLFDKVEKLSDLSQTSVTIGALRGAVYSYHYFEMLQQEAFSQRIIYIGDDQAIPEFVLKGRVDAYIDSELEGRYLLKTQQRYHDQIVPFIRITTPDDAKSNLMFSKKNISADLVMAFDKALQDLHSSGEYEQIFNRFTTSDVDFAIKQSAK